MEMERRFCERMGLVVERRAAGEAQQPVISGYAAVFNSLSVVMWGWREQIAPGAFANSMGDDIRALWNHDTGDVLGRTKAGTLTLAEDNTGLRCEILPPASAAAYVESIQRGDVDQMSFGFQALDETWDLDAEGMLIRTLTKVKLYEVSPVTFAAYPATSVGVRSADGGGRSEVDPVFGVIPNVPVEFRRALKKTDHIQNGLEQLARARWVGRQRQLELMG